MHEMDIIPVKHLGPYTSPLGVRHELRRRGFVQLTRVGQLQGHRFSVLMNS